MMDDDETSRDPMHRRQEKFKTFLLEGKYFSIFQIITVTVAVELCYEQIEKLLQVVFAKFT